MSRFANDEPVTRPTSSPTTVVDDASSHTVRDVEADAGNQRDSSWLRRSRKPSDKPKLEKAEEVDQVEEVDGVWGKLGDGAPNYKNVSWIESSCFMINLQIGIGVLGLPATLAQIGMIPGIILIILSGIITTWADTVIGLFKKGHPEVYSVADVGGIMGGRFGRELFGSMYWLFCVLVGAGQVVAFSTAMNSITQHGACTIIWILIGSVGGIVIGMYRTLDKIGWMQWVGLVSLMGALITAAAAAGVQDPPAGIEVRMVNNPGFLPGVQAGTNIILAFTGGPAFYNILSEMKHTKEFNKAVYWAQGFVTATYLIIACVIYGFVGGAVASPALGSVGPLLQRICYGIIIPGLVIGAVLYIHIPAKYVFVRALRDTRHLTESTWQHWTAWTGCVVGTGLLIFILANAIPVFNDLLTLISSLCGTPLAVTIPAAMWIWETRRTRPSSERGVKWWFGVALCLAMIAVSCFITVAGTVSAVVSLNNAVQAGEAAPFSCADNSQSS